jgi:ABC-type transporter Mla MlaB component
MAKDETTPGGIFSKVARFVRNPATNWSDLDEKSSDKDAAYSKQALKEMIERKRRNDFVRKREFDMLRKMRHREAMGGAAVPGEAGRPSFFQSSMPSKPDERAVTLKKIDEIEAQMSMQWWKTKHGAGVSAGAGSSFSSSDMAPSERLEDPKTAQAKAMAMNPMAYAPTAADDLTNALAMARASAARAVAPSPVVSAPIPALAMVVTPPPAPKVEPAVAPVAVVAPKAESQEAGDIKFSVSKMFAMEVEDVQHDPELEEAAIRFANGDDEGAEAGLLEALSSSGSRNKHEETWFTAFDLYRATGKQDRFESLAIDYAGKFSRSAPMWFSMPDIVGKLAKDSPGLLNESGHKSDWRAPTSFGIQTLAALNAALAKAQAPWVLDWSILKSIDANALAPLTKLFASWSAQPVQLRFKGADNLEELLRNATPSGARDVSQDYWTLRMEHLRISHRPDEFELAALDFCVTYEVSPPSWESARCEYKAINSEGISGIGQTIIGEAVHDSILSALSGYGDSKIDGAATSTPHKQLSSVELSGQIQGDPAAMLEKLEARLIGADVMVISCAKLIRVDFSAAGTLLNWVSARQSEGRMVNFTEVHRLVAAFFHVIGISEHAKVIPRID